MKLRTSHLGKRFGGVTALDDVSVEFRAGEIHALCGENGAGKSTLIKLLSGVHPHGSYSGRIEVDGREARFRSVRDAAASGIAVIHQELALVNEMSVADNICLGHEPRRWGGWVDGDAVRQVASALLDQFGVPLSPDTPVGELGMGQKQLVEILKALARDSRILILDEPTAALAAHEVAVLLEILRELRRRQIACVYISHRLEEVFDIADRITVLRDGAAVCSRPAHELDPGTVVRFMVGREVADPYARPPSAPGGEVLAVTHLSVTQSGQQRLSDISFSLRSGEVLGIGGLMGAGRSELLMHLFGVWGERTHGGVTTAGIGLRPGDPRAALRAGIVLVSEDRRRYGLFADESVGFNLSMASLETFARSGVIQGGAEARANRHWFDSLGIKARSLDAPVAGLSGGNQQKVVLGRALMTEPVVVMLDEPTRGIDMAAKQDIYTLINRLTATGCAVLLVSSELPELIGMSDRILMMVAGRIHSSFERREVTPERLMRAALGSRAADARPRS